MLSYLVDQHRSDGPSRSLNLAVKKCAAVVGQGPAELQVLPDQSLWRCVVRNGLELLNKSVLGRVLGAAPPRKP